MVFSFIGLMFGSPVVTAGTFVVLFAWFAVSWYLFKLMQLLLFGPHREDIRYDDLNTTEIAAFAGILLLLIAIIVAPQGVFDTVAEKVARIEMEIK